MLHCGGVEPSHLLTRGHDSIGTFQKLEADLILVAKTHYKTGVMPTPNVYRYLLSRHTIGTVLGVKQMRGEGPPTGAPFAIVIASGLPHALGVKGTLNTTTHNKLDFNIGCRK